MSKTPLHIIISRLSKDLDCQVQQLVALVAAEKPYSVRRSELLSLLQERKRKQIKRDNRRAAKAA